MKKKWMTIVAGILSIALVTVLLLVFLPGEKDDGKGGREKRPSTDAVTTEAAPGSTEKISVQPVTEELTWESTEQASASGAGKEEKTEQTSASEKGTEENPEQTSGPDPDTESGTEEPAETTEETVDGSGGHQGKLGFRYSIPKGFNDISPAKKLEDGFHYIYENPEYQMQILISECYEAELPVTFNMQYSVLHGIYQNDTGTRVTKDEKLDREYMISGYTDDLKQVFLIRGMAMQDQVVVQINSQYPDGENKEACDAMLQEFLDSCEYFLAADPGTPKEEIPEVWSNSSWINTGWKWEIR